MRKGENMESIGWKREREKQVVSQMIWLYCKKHHHQGGMCAECREILEYAEKRSDHCPFMKQKTFCSNCKVHCYRPDMRHKIRKIMEFSGPRMVIYHPFLAISHMAMTIKERMRKREE